MDIPALIQNIIIFFQNPDGLVKIALILILLLFLLFTLIFNRQITHLIELVDQVSFSPILKFIVYGVTFATLVLLILTILV